MFSTVYGSQIIDPYSNVGLMSVWYARTLMSFVQERRFLLTKPNTLLPLATTWFMCVFHFKLLENSMPRQEWLSVSCSVLLQSEYVY